jgi:hypothetical protein
MKKLSAKDVRLDILLHNFKDVTKDGRLLHDQSIGKVMRKMAEKIYNSKNGISLLCMETSQSTMDEFDISTLHHGYRHHMYYIHTIDRLIHLADQLAIALAKIKCSRDHLFDDEFSYDLVEIMKMEEEAAPVLGTFSSHSMEQYHNSRLKVSSFDDDKSP